MSYTREEVEEGLKAYFGDRVLFYLKFTKRKEWADNLTEGKLFMNTIEVFRKLESKNSSKGQGDKQELKLPLKFEDISLKCLEIEEDIKLNPGTVTFEFKDDKYIPAFCICGLTIDDMELSKYDDNNVTMNLPFNEKNLDLLKKEFGEYVVVIGNEFENRVNNIIKDNGRFKKVKYGDGNEWDKVDSFFKCNPDRFFFKSTEFKYQREYRIVIDEKVEGSKVLEIGDLKDISHVMKIEDFINYQYSFKVLLNED